MPGLVLDPHQNPEEKDFGIVYSTERKKCYRYRKQAENLTRFYLFGEVVDIELPNEDDEERVEEGCYITHGWATITGYTTNQDLSPVYKRVIRIIPEVKRRNAIRDAINDGMPSPFPPPN
jgi:hypothetical protein